ncbi:hypothetical protein [Nocardia sp. R6R-6]|uniref:hypothetical protein n=1 Tax=Nocardia sp. R6R-6 TaxID=3459303 RepID=UPI00403E25C1
MKMLGGMGGITQVSPEAAAISDPADAGRVSPMLPHGEVSRLFVSVVGATVERVSVNINVAFSIRELRDERERAGVTALLTDVLESESLSSEVFITFGGDGESLSVTVDSDYPVIFSGFYRWQDPFEAMLTSRVTALVPHAELVFDWEYADED